MFSKTSAGPSTVEPSPKRGQPKIVPYSEADHYPHIRGWWEAWYQGDIIPARCLAPTGVVALLDDLPAGASFAYPSNAAIAMVAFTVVDPVLSARSKLTVLEAVSRAAFELGRKMVEPEGFVIAYTDNKGLIHLYQKMGLTAPGLAETFYLKVGSQDGSFLE